MNKISTETVELHIVTQSAPTPNNPGAQNIFYFTTSEKPVTYAGKQFIPLSSYDAAKWCLKSED